MFGRAIAELSLITIEFTNFIYERWGHLLRSMNQTCLSPNKLETFVASIHQKGLAVRNCWRFGYGSIQPDRPGSNQRTLYNGHKRVHAIKYQALSAPNGLCANLRGPHEGKKHNSSMLQDSGLLTVLSQYSHESSGNILRIYGDPAYPLFSDLGENLKIVISIS